MDNQLAKKRILVTGVTGQVGRALSQQLKGRCELVTAARHGADINLDLSNFDQITSTINNIRPDIVINPAAYTQVDQAEDELELASIINGQAPGIIAEACKKIDATLIHYSTDYVFNGKANKPYKETDPTDPVNVYGETKLAGEKAIQAVDCGHLIFRTCWVYDAFGKNFPNAILNRAKTIETLKVVNDQIGTPTSAEFIADITQKALVQSLTNGIHSSRSNHIYNLRPDGECSWFDFAKEVIEYMKPRQQLVVNDILPVPSSAFPTKAARPSWSVLDNNKIKDDFSLEFEQWQGYIKSCFDKES
jgi:dTDP-4-dehydrorhamnose reductase